MEQQQTQSNTKRLLIENVEIHPATAIFPMMEEAELKELAEDIKKNGLKTPIELAGDGRVIDGRNRIEACKLVNILTIETVNSWLNTEEAIIRYIISLNLHRRHLTESQRADVAARLASGQHGGDRSKASIEALTQEKAAQQLSVSESSLQRAKYVQTHGVPELQDAVKKGEVKVAAAAVVASAPPEEQMDLLTQGKEAVKAKAKEIRTKIAKPATDTTDKGRQPEKQSRKQHEKLLKKILQIYETLPEEFRKRVVKELAEKSPVVEWLRSPNKAGKSAELSEAT